MWWWVVVREKEERRLPADCWVSMVPVHVTHPFLFSSSSYSFSSSFSSSLPSFLILRICPSEGPLVWLLLPRQIHQRSWRQAVGLPSCSHVGWYNKRQWCFVGPWVCLFHISPLPLSLPPSFLENNNLL